MSRELKFRAWDGDKMHKVWSLLGTNLCKVPKKSYPYSEDIVVKDIMQYTGIEDYEGLEVYEGDIIEFKNEKGNYYKVYWDDCSLRYLAECGENVRDLFFGDNSEFTIISNIYEVKVRPMTKACKVCVSYIKKTYPNNEPCKTCNATKNKDISKYYENPDLYESKL